MLSRAVRGRDRLGSFCCEPCDALRFWLTLRGQQLKTSFGEHCAWQGGPAALFWAVSAPFKFRLLTTVLEGELQTAGSFGNSRLQE